MNLDRRHYIAIGVAAVLLLGALGYWLARGDGGDVGAMLWLIIYLGILAGVLWWRFSAGKWRTITLVEPTLPSAAS